MHRQIDGYTYAALVRVKYKGGGALRVAVLTGQLPTNYSWSVKLWAGHLIDATARRHIIFKNHGKTRLHKNLTLPQTLTLLNIDSVKIA